jgi:hypothetical protein
VCWSWLNEIKVNSVPIANLLFLSYNPPFPTLLCDAGALWLYPTLLCFACWSLLSSAYKGHWKAEMERSPSIWRPCKKILLGVGAVASCNSCWSHFSVFLIFTVFSVLVEAASLHPPSETLAPAEHKFALLRWLSFSYLGLLFQASVLWSIQPLLQP